MCVLPKLNSTLGGRVGNYFLSGPSTGSMMRFGYVSTKGGGGGRGGGLIT